MRKIVWLALLAACGDDDPATTSGVDPSALIVDLDEPRLKRICRWISDHEYAYDKTWNCPADAVQRAWEDGLDRAACKREQDSCVERARAAREPRRADELARCETMTLAKPREGCTATVGKLERCYRDTLQTEALFAGQFSCSAIEGPVLEPDYYPPESCADVSLSCYPVGGLEDR
jgi:hypothetical protein